MKIVDIQSVVKQGKKPMIKFTEGIYDFAESSVDSGMIGKITSVTDEYKDENSLTLHVSLNGFEDHNKSVAKRDWFDSDRQPTLTWFESGMYPENGSVEIFIDMDWDVESIFTIIEENDLLQEYASQQNPVSYVEWLESLVISLRNEAKTDVIK